MTTISITNNERNKVAQKAIDFILSLGHFRVENKVSLAKKKTLKAINDARNGINVTKYDSFEDYLKAVERH